MPKSQGTRRMRKYPHPTTLGMLPSNDSHMTEATTRLVDRFNQVAPDLHLAILTQWEWPRILGHRRGMIEVSFGQNRDYHQIRFWSRNFVNFQAGDRQVEKALARFNVRCQGDNLSQPMQCTNVAQYILKDPDNTLWAGCWECREIAQGPRYKNMPLDSAQYEAFLARERVNHPVKVWEA